jgi:hypothetical protein
MIRYEIVKNDKYYDPIDNEILQMDERLTNMGDSNRNGNYDSLTSWGSSQKGASWGSSQKGASWGSSMKGSAPSHYEDTSMKGAEWSTNKDVDNYRTCGRRILF